MIIMDWVFGFLTGIATCWVHQKYGARLDAAALRCRRWILAALSRGEAQ